MADRRAPLSEETLRETKDDLVRRITDQKRAGGVPNEPGLEADPLGGQRAAEDYIDPILRKVEIDHNRDRDRDLVRVDPDDLSPKFADSKQEVGTYDWNLKTDEVVAHPGSWQAQKQARSDVHQFIKALRLVPEWKALFNKIALTCKLHYRPERFCVPCDRREAAFRHAVARALVEYQRKSKITVGG